MDHSKPVMDDTKRKRLETRIQRRNEYRRTRFLKEYYFRDLSEHLEEADVPIVVFRDSRIIYANPSAMNATGYRFDQLSTFNNLELDTGTSKKRMDYVLDTAKELGLNTLEFDTSISTLDQKVLEMSPQMHRISAEGKDYWFTELTNLRKNDPSAISTRVLGWLHRLFQRSAVLMRAPELVYKGFAEKVIKNIADPHKNVLVDFSQTKYIEEEAIEILRKYSSHELFKNQLFMTISNPGQYHWLTYKKVPASNIYLPKGIQLEGARE